MFIIIKILEIQLSVTHGNEHIKYQGVKEFDMLARIGCYCKIMVFSPFKVKVIYYHSSKGNQ